MADPKAEDPKAQRKAYRAELKELQNRGTIIVKPGTSPMRVDQLSPDDRRFLAAEGRPIPGPLTAQQAKRLHELHYLAIGEEVPIREDDD